jgi:glycosyltransferase involved in cell wall biosynthesis
VKILWLSWKSITHPDAGGAEIVGHENAKALVNAGHQVYWVSLAPDKWLNPLLPRIDHSTYQIRKEGVNYLFIGHRKIMYLGLFHVFVFVNYLLFWRRQVEFVIEEIHGPALLTPMYVFKKKLVVIHEVAGEIWQKTVPQPLAFVMENIVEPMMFGLYRKTKIITVSKSTKSDLCTLGIPPKNISIVHNGFLPRKPDGVIRKESKPTLIFLSAVRPMKGLERILRIYFQILKTVSNLQLWVVGDDSTEYAQKQKQKFGGENGSGAEVTFFGHVTEDKKYELLHRAHILVHGSYKEGWGRVVIEANSVGVPAVAFDVGGLRESIRNNQTGFLVQNESLFAEKVELLIERKDLYAKLSLNARKWSQNFAWTEVTKKFVDHVKLESIC